MIWQDIVFLGCSTVGVLTLYPTLRDRTSQIPGLTSVSLGLICLMYGITFASLGMTLAAIGVTIKAGLWLLIAAFRRSTTSTGVLRGVWTRFHSEREPRKRRAA